MKLINIGCGSTYHRDWVNLDLVSNSSEVQAFDIRAPLPFRNNYFNCSYTSHVIEHLTQEEAESLISECFRILKPQGIVRIIVPDLEGIVRAYLGALEQVESGDLSAEADYDWMMLELYDQATRKYKQGKMGDYLANLDTRNKSFVISRIGSEAEVSSAKRKTILQKLRPDNVLRRFPELGSVLIKGTIGVIAGKTARQAFEEGLFRNSGEIHQWMYDRFSLKRLLQKVGFVGVKTCRADESRIPNFNSYNLDVIDGKVRKPDSLFMEGLKP